MKDRIVQRSRFCCRYFGWNSVLWAAVLAAMLLVGGSALADGTVSGKVTDPDGNPIAEAIVRPAGDQRQTTTADDGTYSISLPARTYQLLVIAGGHKAARLFTLVESCRRLGINPHEYLTDVLTRIPTTPTAQLVELTPSLWKPASAD